MYVSRRVSVLSSSVVLIRHPAGPWTGQVLPESEPRLHPRVADSLFAILGFPAGGAGARKAGTRALALAQP